FSDALEEACADDAATALEKGDASVVEVPVVLLRGGAHEREALRVGADLRAIESSFDRFEELLSVAVVARGRRAREPLRSRDTFGLGRGDRARLDRFDDRRSGNAEIEGRDRS